jgi:alkaline phosphatase D
VKANEALATYHLIPSTEVSRDYSLKPGEELTAKATSQRLRVQNGAITAI